jgi:hypothetical protein
MFLVQCEELRFNHLIALLVVTMPYACWFLWWAVYTEDFKWRLHFQIGVCHFSVHLRKGRVVLSQCPLVRWASGHWHYKRTLHSRRPLAKKGTRVSIYLNLGLCFVLREVYFEGPNRIWKALKTSILNIDGGGERALVVVPSLFMFCGKDLHLTN